MLMENQVKIHSPQNISGASQQNSVFESVFQSIRDRRTFGDLESGGQARRSHFELIFLRSHVLNAPMLFCWKAPEMFCGLRNFPLAWE